MAKETKKIRPWLKGAPAALSLAISIILLSLHFKNFPAGPFAGPFSDVLRELSNYAQDPHILGIVLIAAVMIHVITALSSYWRITLKPIPKITGVSATEYVRNDIRKYLHTVYLGAFLGLIAMLGIFLTSIMSNRYAHSPFNPGGSNRANEDATKLVADAVKLTDGFRKYEPGIILENLERRQNALSQLDKMSVFWEENDLELDLETRSRFGLMAVKLSLLGNRLDDASDWLHRIKPIHVKYKEWPYRLGAMILFAKGKPKEAIEMISASPGDRRKEYVVIADWLTEIKKFDDASDLLDQYLAFYSNDPPSQTDVACGRWMSRAIALRSHAEVNRKQSQDEKAIQWARTGLAFVSNWLDRPDLALLDRIEFEKDKFQLLSSAADAFAHIHEWDEVYSSLKDCTRILEVLVFERKQASLHSNLVDFLERLLEVAPYQSDPELTGKYVRDWLQRTYSRLIELGFEEYSAHRPTS